MGKKVEERRRGLGANKARRLVSFGLELRCRDASPSMYM